MKLVSTDTRYVKKLRRFNVEHEGKMYHVYNRHEHDYELGDMDDDWEVANDLNQDVTGPLAETLMEFVQESL